MPLPLFIVADIGGTNARFAAFQGEQCVAAATYKTADHDDLHALAKAFASTLPKCPTIVVAAAAGPVQDNAVRLTNGGHCISGAALQEATGAEHAYVINDFAAAAWATLDLAPKDLSVIAGAPYPPPGTRVVIGPGTGLGVSALVFDGKDYHCVTGEGGHIGIGPNTAFEIAVFEALFALWPEAFFGHPLKAEAEAILSGAGLPLLYQAVATVEGQSSHAKEPDTIFSAAQSGGDAIALKTIEIFKTQLAEFAGDLGLLFGASGGVLIAGGIAQQNPSLFDTAFTEALANGGHFSATRRTINIYLLHRPDLGLTGARMFAQMQWRQG